MDKLPVEIQAFIFHFFPLDERAKLRGVSKYFKGAVEYNLRGVEQIEFACYSADASAQNYLSRTRKNPNIFWASPLLGKSFWSFINTYCGNSIEINAEGYNFKTEDILSIASKLKFITCESISSYDDHKADIFNHFTRLEGFKTLCPPSNFYIKYYPWCTSLLAQYREAKGQRVLCLSLPCKHSFQCHTNRTELPVGLQRLMLNCATYGHHPRVTPEVSWSLVELLIDGLPNLNNFSPAFSSLKRLTFRTETVKEGPILALLNLFMYAIGQLEEFTFVGDVSAKVEKKIYNLAAHGKQLRTFVFIYDPYSRYLDGSVEEKPVEVMKIELNSPKLKRFVIQTRRQIAVNVTAPKLHHFEIIKAPSVALALVSCHLAYFELVGAKISFDLPQLIASAKRLRFLILKHLKLSRESMVRIIRSTNNNRSIQKIHFKNVFDDSEQPTEVKFLEQIEYAPRVRSDFQLIVSNCPDLKEVKAYKPHLDTVFDDNIRAIKLECKNDLSIKFTRLDGIRCTVSSFNHALKFNFRGVMSNLIIFSVYVEAITLPLVNDLVKYCHNVRGVQVTTRVWPKYCKEVLERWTKWVASQKNLRVIFGYFTQVQMIYILENLKTNKLVVNIDVDEETRTFIVDRFHRLITDLSQRQVLVKYSFPWRCSCGAKCPLFDPPHIEFDKMESYV